MEAACAAPSTALPHILCQHCPVFPWTLTLGLSALPAGLDSAPDSLRVQLMCHQHCPHLALSSWGTAPQACQSLGLASTHADFMLWLMVPNTIPGSEIPAPGHAAPVS